MFLFNAYVDSIYDENRNLNYEQITVGDGVYTLDYDFNGNDYIEKITYPSGRELLLNPNAMGWATTVGGFVSDVVYFDNGTVNMSSIQHWRRWRNLTSIV